MKSLSLALWLLVFAAAAHAADNPAQDPRLFDAKPLGNGQKFEQKLPDGYPGVFKKQPPRQVPITPPAVTTLEPEPPAPANPPSQGSVKAEEIPGGPITLYAAGNYRLRRGPWGRIQLIIPKGKTFQLLRKEGAWYVVSYNGKTGYVHETGITHPLAEALRKQHGFEALRRNEAAEIAACLSNVKEPGQIPELQDVLKGIQAFIAQDSSEIDSPPPARPDRVKKETSPGKREPAKRPARPDLGTPVAKVDPVTPAAPDELISPIKGRTCTTGGRRFGCYTHPILGGARFHSGVDIQAPSGTPIVAPAEGCTLIDQRDQKKTGGYGHQLRLQCGKRVISYSHLSRFAPAKRQYAKGEVVAYVGSTGRSTGAHLHLEVLEGGHRVDPAYVFGLKTFCPRIRPENKRASGCGRGNPIRQRRSR